MDRTHDLVDITPATANILGHVPINVTAATTKKKKGWPTKDV